MTYEPTNAEYVRAATEAGFYEHELNPSLRDFANRIAYDAQQKLRAELQAEGWRQCAKGQHTSQFCGQLEAAVAKSHEAIQALQIEAEQLKAERNRSGVELRNAVAKAVREERARWDPFTRSGK